MRLHFRKLSLLMAGSLLASCSMSKDIDEMHDATITMRDQTREMNDTIKQMNEQTKKLGDTSQSLDRQTAELYPGLRQSEGKTQRQGALEKILKEPDAFAKAAIAKWYLISFEYQMFTGIGLDTPESRTKLATLAAHEFMWHMNSFLRPGQTEVDPLAKADPTFIKRAYDFFRMVGQKKFEKALTTDFIEEGNRQASFNAIAAALQEVHPKQDDLLKAQKNFVPLSMLTLIEDSLRAKKEIDSGRKSLDQYPGYVREVLQYENIARLLLQARYNVLGATVITNLTPLRESETDFVGLYVNRWPIDVSNWNFAQRELNSQYLTWALHTYDFMLEVGIEPEMDSRLRVLMVNGFRTAESEQRLRLLRARFGGAAPEVLSMAEYRFLNLFDSYRISSARRIGSETGGKILQNSKSTPKYDRVIVSSPPPAPAAPPERSDRIERIRLPSESK